MNLQNVTVTIPAGGITLDNTGANAFTVISTTLPLQLIFDGGITNNATAGSGYSTPWKSVAIKNPNSTAITVTYAIGDTISTFTPASNAVSNALTFPFANGGIATGDGRLNSQGFITLSAGNFPNGLTLKGTNNGHARQQMKITVKPNGGSGLLIYDTTGAGGTAGNLLLFINAPTGVANAIVVLQENIDVILKNDSSAGNPPLVAVWESFLNQ
ncbi:MAG TPA: hypothetical protein VK742_08345 [Candidatus Sulfotelmatobacter sp.]|jgi:hypothetical protein|nr:hypothetical protein [Candidatus Sulfotelmatobacter sp.]